jgi:MbtH protein
MSMSEKEEVKTTEDMSMSEKEEVKTTEDMNTSEKEEAKPTESMNMSEKEKEEEKPTESINKSKIEKEKIYRVLVNGEEQYSLWAADHKIPNGWQSVGPTGPKDVCLSFVKEVWTDMRPRSLRENNG